MGAALSPHVDQRPCRSSRRFSAVTDTRISAHHFNRVLQTNIASIPANKAVKLKQAKIRPFDDAFKSVS